MRNWKHLEGRKIMNEERRKKLTEALVMVEKALDLVGEIREDEEDSFNNLSESLQQTPNGQKLGENVSALEEALGDLENSITAIDTAMAP
jgi:hypothetical protein